MKKALSVILCAAMLLSLCAFNISAAWDGTTASASLAGEGTQASPYIVATAEDLAYLAKSVNEGNTYEGKYITQTADIDLGGKEWTPIGHRSPSENPFSGVYDGKGFKVVGLKITQKLGQMGLFGYITATDSTPAGVANLSVSGEITIDGCAEEQHIAGLCGDIYKNSNTLIAKEIYIINTTVDVDITVTNCSCQARVGGFGGWCYSATFENCVNNGDISVSSTKPTRGGGFYGQGSRMTVTNCVNNGNVTVSSADTNNASGFAAGHTDCKTDGAKESLFTNCVNNGNITAVSTGKTQNCYTGGIIGGPYKYATGLDTKIVNCVNNGKISNTLTTKDEGYTGTGYPYTGGIAACVNYPDFSIEGSVNTGEIISVGGNGARAGGIIGVMNNSAATTLFLKDCSTVGKLSAYIKNAFEGCTENAEAAVVAASAKTIEDAIVPSTITIAGFDTAYKAPEVPEETTAPETTAPETTAPEATEPAPETTEPSSSTPTGDSFAIFAAIAAVALIGVAVVAKRKEN